MHVRDNKIILLDRDGVINHDSKDYIKSPDEWRPINGSLEAIAQLCQAGYRMFVVSNQSALGRGLITETILQAIHDKMRRALRALGGDIENIYYCPHHPDDGCDCRKPKIGMLKQIAQDTSCALQGVPFVGDSLTDIQAAQAMGCQPVLVRTGKGEKTFAQLSLPSDIPVFRDLADFAAHYLHE